MPKDEGTEASMTLAMQGGDAAFRPIRGPFRMSELSSSRFAPSDSAVFNFAPGEEVVGEGDPADHFYMVVKGVFRAIKVTRDGRRQIFAFYLPGDMCALEPGARYNLTIEAVNAGSMAALSRTACRARMNRDPAFNSAVFEGATRSLALAVDHMTMVGRSSAEERLAWFLTMLRDRASAGRHLPVVELAMQRQDIADYLGLTIETVSRTFTHMKERGVIALRTTRRVEILKPEQLMRLAAADRDAPISDRKSYA
jgi:CRP/FNR family transcriptional regulator, nitrogen fixation regulation protein